MYTGPKVTNKNLVFGYDTGYGVADPGLSTRFYKGRPTVNLGADRVATLHDSSGGAAATVVDAPEKGVGWKKVTITARGTNFRVIQFGSYVSFSANTLYSESFEADWGNMRGKGYSLTFDGSGGGSRNWFKNGSYATGVTSNIAVDSTLLDGHIGGNITKSSTHVHVWFLYNNSTSTTGLNDYFYYKDLQIEVGTIPTPYVDGTRSDTASLIDLKRTASINVSNISFDSTGQPTFDGTNDYIDVTTNFGTLAQYSFEWVENPNATHKMPISTRQNTAFYKYGAYSWRYTHGGTAGEFYHTAGATSGWHHWAITYDGSTLKIFQDNISLGTRSVTGTADFSQGLKIGWWSAGGAYAFDGDIPVMKFYNKALTADEVAQNYKAYKNRFNI